MKLSILTAAAIGLLSFAAACPPAPAPQASDAGAADADPCASTAADCDPACRNLALLGCPEGNPIASCVATCAAAQGKVTDLKPACLARAKTQEEARAVGTVKCLAVPAFHPPGVTPAK